jgi:NitT/TauT family transport system permease protein
MIRWLSPSRTAQRGFLGIALVLLVWEGSVRIFDLKPYVLPSISNILVTIVERRNGLGYAGLYTLAEALAGYAIGTLCGIALATVSVMVPLLRGPTVKLATAVNAVPVVGYAPLILIWFGVGMPSKVVAVAMAVGFVLFVSALSGFDRVDHRAVDLLRSFGAGRLAILWRLRLPTALPLILAGMRVSTVRSIIVAIVVEMLGAYDGLGWVIYQSVLQIDFIQVWAAIFVASATSLLFFGIVGTTGARMIFWR